LGGDEMGIASSMTGTPWHTELMRRGDNDPRRHKTKCVNYDTKTKQCKKQKFKCIGSAHCDYYDDGSGRRNRAVSIIKIERKIDLNTQTKNDARCKYAIGTEVKSKNYGYGTLCDKYQNIVVIRFGDIEKKFIYPECVKLGSIKFLEK
jgi:hypothetical protein